MGDLYGEVQHDNVFNSAAALGFYLTLAIFPGMIFVMAVILYLPTADVDRAIMDLLRQALHGATAYTFSGVVDEVANERCSGLLPLGLAALMIYAVSLECLLLPSAISDNPKRRE